MDNGVSENGENMEGQNEIQSLNKWQILIGICIALGLVWMFMPKFGGPEYDPIDISSFKNSDIISHYRFGKITIADKEYYDLDVIIFPDRVKYDWGGMKDHELYPDEIEDVANEDIKTVVIGTGSQGNAFIKEETIQLLESKGITTHVMDTFKAVAFYNKLPKEKLVGVFHLTE